MPSQLRLHFIEELLRLLMQGLKSCREYYLDCSSHRNWEPSQRRSTFPPVARHRAWWTQPATFSHWWHIDRMLMQHKGDQEIKAYASVTLARVKALVMRLLRGKHVGQENIRASANSARISLPVFAFAIAESFPTDWDLSIF